MIIPSCKTLLEMIEHNYDVSFSIMPRWIQT